MAWFMMVIFSGLRCNGFWTAIAVQDWLLSGAARAVRLSEVIDSKLRAQVIGQ
jgi:hypothetical protein